MRTGARFRELYTRKRMTLALLRLSAEPKMERKLKAAWWALAWAALNHGRDRQACQARARLRRRVEH